MKLHEARKLKEEMKIRLQLPTRGIREITFTKKTVTVEVTSEWVARQLPEFVENRKVWYVVVGR